jgi:hypothetical protein
VGPASRPVLVIVGIMRDAVATGVTIPPGPRLPRAVRSDLQRLQDDPVFGGVPPAVFARGMTAWTQLFGALSFELFGRLANAIEDVEAYFDYQLRAMAQYLGL